MIQVETRSYSYYIEWNTDRGKSGLMTYNEWADYYAQCNLAR